MEENQNITSYDVIVVGAGLSGIDAAYHLQTKCPEKSFTILEARENMGGTWDLFKYPGIRSDSDMYTLGFPFNPWENPKSIADGPAILKYIKDTAAKFGIDQKIQYSHKVINANWSDAEEKWTIEIAEHEDVPYLALKCKFLLMCSGYYDYNKGYTPEFPMAEKFNGQIIHPQKWTSDIDYEGKKIIVIGSGATAVTLVPELAKKASKVIMLQRTPTYILTLPSKDKIALSLRKVLPENLAYKIIRWKNILISLGLYKASRKWPNAIRNFIQKGVRRQLGPDVEMKHFDPPYNPWDQRLCLVPDADFFRAIKKGNAEVITDHIDQFTEKGILLKSGEELEADLVVTATGLKVQLMGGMEIQKNGETVKLSDTHAYRGVMFSGIPNFAFTVGYTNASWTLKSDLSCLFVVKLLNYMKKNNYSVCTPRFDSGSFESEPLLDFDAGYILRALDVLPKQGSKYPWKVYQNYVLDLMSLKVDSVKDKYLEYK